MSIPGRFLRYSSVALTSAGSDWIVFWILGAAGTDHLQALMASRVAGGLVSFLANRHWTWRANRGLAVTRQGRRFLVLYGFSYLSAIGLFALLVGGLGLSPYPGKLLTDGCCFIGNFLVMNAYVFHRRDGLGRLLGPDDQAPSPVGRRGGAE